MVLLLLGSAGLRGRRSTGARRRGRHDSRLGGCSTWQCGWSPGVCLVLSVLLAVLLSALCRLLLLLPVAALLPLLLCSLLVCERGTWFGKSVDQTS